MRLCDCYFLLILVNLVLVVVCSDTGRKVDDPELLEAIRLTIINNMLQYHPVFFCKYLFLGLTCPLIEISCRILVSFEVS